MSARWRKPTILFFYNRRRQHFATKTENVYVRASRLAFWSEESYYVDTLSVESVW